MSLNTAHVSGGVLIHSGECILLFSEDVSLDFSGTDTQAMKGTKTGRIYLTTHRMIFNNNKHNDALLSFSFPFITMNDVELEQPVFGANYLKGKVRAQPNGNWVGEAKFKIIFKKGGCIDFAQAMLKAASMASRNAGGNVPPPYTPPTGPWYQAPPPAYAPDPTGYYGWTPPTHAFPQQPPVDAVYMTDTPPPYPGINPGYTGYAPASGNVGPAQPPPVGFAPPPMMNGAAGFTPNGLSSSEAKAAEAAQSAYYDPNKPQCAYVPPPAYYNMSGMIFGLGIGTFILISLTLISTLLCAVSSRTRGSIGPISVCFALVVFLILFFIPRSEESFSGTYKEPPPTYQEANKKNQ